MAEDNPEAGVEKEGTVADFSKRGLSGCPACGSTKYHRSRRSRLERLCFRPPMARCEKCGTRFPYPRYPDEPSDSVESGEAAVTETGSAEEQSAPEMAEESSGARVDEEGTATDFSSRGMSRCPFCGCTVYRRSRRTTLEHLLLRPPMARCRRCRKRFPYPKR